MVDLTRFLWRIEVKWRSMTMCEYQWRPERDIEEAGMARGVHASNTACQRSVLMEL
jgi:hypothetical protein